MDGEENNTRAPDTGPKNPDQCEAKEYLQAVKGTLTCAKEIT